MFANYHVKNIAAHFHQKPVEGSWICLQYFEQISAFGGFSAESARGTLHLVHVRSVPHHHYILTRHAPRVLCVKHDVRLMIHTDFDNLLIPNVPHVQSVYLDFLEYSNCFFSGQLPSVSTKIKHFIVYPQLHKRLLEMWEWRSSSSTPDEKVCFCILLNILFYITLTTEQSY